MITGVGAGKEDAGVVGVDAKEDKGDGSSLSLRKSTLMTSLASSLVKVSRCFCLFGIILSPWVYPQRLESLTFLTIALPRYL